MKLAVISTGTELLRGSTVNSNLAFLGKVLTANGLKVDFEIAAGDSKVDLCRAIGWALDNCEILLITGGLGPTSDDITLETAARFFGKELHMDEELKIKVENFWNRLHQGHCPKMQYKQALLPEGGEAIPNPTGSAAGIYFKSHFDQLERHVFLAPGPPAEFEPMVENELLPRLCKLMGCVEVVKGFLVAGVGESLVNRTLVKVLPETGLSVAYTAKPEGTRVYLAGPREEEIIPEIEKLHDALLPAALPEGEYALAPYLLKLLRQRNETLATAESCTGGLISAEFTAVPGASEVYLGGIVSYSNQVKAELLDVPSVILQEYGAVSEETVRFMAVNAAKKFGAAAAVSASGIAGPTGGTAEKPVGLVYVGAFYRGVCKVEKWNFRGNREAVRTRTMAKALILLRQMMEEVE